MQRARRALPFLDRAIVRGRRSAQHLGAMVGNPERVEVAPDLGWLIPRHADDWQTLRARVATGHGLDLAPAGFIVFHTMAPCLDGEARLVEIARTLEGFQPRQQNLWVP
jgi:hypothetical protein